MAEIQNYVPNSLVSGTSKADYISNTWDEDGEGGIIMGDNVTIKALAGNDTIINDGGSNAIIFGGKGNDSISLDEYRAKNNVIKYASGDGNDTVIGFNSDDTLHITKGKYTTDTVGNDFIVTVGKGKIVLKDVLVGNNSINIQNSSGKVVTYNDWTVWNGSIENNIKDNVTLAGSNKADTVGNSAKNVLITGQAGNDKISNSGDNVTITGGKGNDTVYSGGDKVTINAGAGNDYISNGEDYKLSDVLINGGSGKDTIYIDGGGDVSDVSPSIKNVTIDGGKGNDLITLEYFEESDGHNISVSGGSGNDTITNETYNSTIIGGKGNDYISLDDDLAKNNLIQYASGDGNDTILGFNADDTLQIAKGSYTTATSGNDLIVTVGKGKITLKDVSSANIIGDNNDSEAGSASVSLTAGNDYYTNLVDEKIIYACGGNDTIINLANNVTVNGGAGDDYFYLDRNKKNTIQYAAGDGNDTITGFDSDDILQITSGTYTTKISGNDVIVTVGDGEIILKDVLGSIQTSSANVAELFAEDNLSEIVAEKAVGEFENYKSDFKQKNLITFAK